ncbi:MAG: hypothetical protein Terrestrivirus6_38 [Terrestrivirus sp.]|uniref:DUF4116 domain-containing protein n=1 Tax=Terrestrivirus sp. TaxID=2487775 RepID=A0A3G4ZNG0_9VIRU|nr:MAG: hypothetical protein Terrestrivirus6_38 [Terrestrivirus sp.]
METFYDNIDDKDNFIHHYNKVSYDTQKESLICATIDKSLNNDLITHIINPSEKVIICAIKKDSTYFEKCMNPSKEIICTYISMNPSEYAKLTNEHKKIFAPDAHELIKMVKTYPKIFPFMTEEEQTEQISYTVIKINVNTIKNVKKQTDKLCAMALLSYAENNKYNNNKYNQTQERIIKHLKIFNDLMIEYIIECKELTIYFCDLPNEYKTPGNIQKAIKNNPHVLGTLDKEIQSQQLCDIAYERDIECIQYILPQFQTDDMKNKIIDSRIVKLFKYIKDMTKQQSIKMFSISPGSIEFIEEINQEKYMCIAAVRHDIKLLKFCTIIDKDIIDYVYESQPYIAKKDRFNFVSDFSEYILIKIVTMRPTILDLLTQEKQTEKIITAALNTNKFAAKYVKNKQEILYSDA